MADDGLSRLRLDRDRNLAEIKSLEVTLARMQAAGSPAVDPTQWLIANFKARVAEVDNFLSAHGSSNASGRKAKKRPPT
jgi:hypothetical protein